LFGSVETPLRGKGIVLKLALRRSDKRPKEPFTPTLAKAAGHRYSRLFPLPSEGESARIRKRETRKGGPCQF
jgi:hypothetical protein